MTLINDQIASSTKKPSKGRWYYEFTHISGTNFHGVGFKLQDRSIEVYPGGCADCLKLYYKNIEVKENVPSNQNIGFANVVAKHTVGLGFDTYSRVFTINYENQIRKFTVLSSVIETKTYPYVVQAHSSTLNFVDTIYMNFGEKEFKYEVPYGYLPWNKSFKLHTCQYQRKTYSFKEFLIIIILIS